MPPSARPASSAPWDLALLAAVLFGTSAPLAKLLLEAWIVFKENFDRRIAAGMLLVLALRHLGTAGMHSHLHYPDIHHRHGHD